MFTAASLVTRSISSKPLMTRSITAVKRPAPQRGRMRPSVSDALRATLWIFGIEYRSY